MTGVVSCVVGYTGGNELNPTYRNLKDHTEALFIEFDPSATTYEQLVVQWSRMHSPLYNTKCQYRSAVWYLTNEQKKVAESVLDRMKEANRGMELYSKVEKVTRFYRAEEYHQSFIAKQRGG